MKKALRRHIRALKRNYTKEQLSAMSRDICLQLLSSSWLNEADTILAYYPLPDEVDIREIIEALVSKGKTLLLPEVVSDTEMVLRRYRSSADLKEGAFGILEPTGPLFTDYGSIDVALIPGMAFDADGNRLGRGKGYYDRFLDAVHGKTSTLPHLIGVCYPFQLLDAVPTDKYDYRVDMVVR